MASFLICRVDGNGSRRPLGCWGHPYRLSVSQSGSIPKADTRESSSAPLTYLPQAPFGVADNLDAGLCRRFCHRLYLPGAWPLESGKWSIPENGCRILVVQFFVHELAISTVPRSVGHTGISIPVASVLLLFLSCHLPFSPAHHSSLPVAQYPGAQARNFTIDVSALPCFLLVLLQFELTRSSAFLRSAFSRENIFTSAERESIPISRVSYLSVRSDRFLTPTPFSFFGSPEKTVTTAKRATHHQRRLPSASFWVELTPNTG